MNNQTHRDFILSAKEVRPASIHGQSLAPLTCNIESGKTVFLVALRHSTALAYLHTLSAIEPPEEGKIFLVGNDCSDLSFQEQLQLRLQVGFMMRGGPLLSVINGIENLKLAARYHQVGDEQEIQQKADLLLAEMPTDFDHQLLPSFMNNLQRRLLAIARPLMLEPEILFLDKPFEGLGHQDKLIVSKYLSNLSKNKAITLIINSDDLAFAHSLANQIIFCDQEVAMVYDNWQEFYNSQRETVTLLFENEKI